MGSIISDPTNDHCRLYWLVRVVPTLHQCHGIIDTLQSSSRVRSVCLSVRLSVTRDDLFQGSVVPNLVLLWANRVKTSQMRVNAEFNVQVRIPHTQFQQLLRYIEYTTQSILPITI